jgi:acyl-CoA synthetase (AMP-forming)/AMP-acid ligase II
LSGDAETLGALLARAALSGQDRGVRFLDASEGDGVRLRYLELYGRARGVAGALQARGLAPGDRVAIVLPTGPAFYDAFFGAVLAGLVPVPLYPPVRLGRMEEYHERTAAMLRACGAKLVLSDRRIRRILGQAVARAGTGLACEAVDALPRRELQPVSVSPDDVAFVQFSSGTTVAPKPVQLSHRQVLANVEVILGAILEAWPEGPELTHVGVSWLPLYHDMGLVGAVLVAVARPGELVLIPPELFVARPAVWLRAISRYRGTTSPAPNFAYALCAGRVRDDELRDVRLESWRIALNGAEPVTPGVLERFVDRFAPFGLRPEALTPVYGLAEATLAVTFSPLRERFRHRVFERGALVREGLARRAEEGQPLVSLGRPLPGFEVRIADEDGDALAPGCLGRVLVRGPSTMSGYQGMPEATAEALRDGWLDTGDTGFLDAGELYLYGRAKDLLVLRGRNHAPQDVEQAIDDLPGVRTGCSAALGLVSEGGDGEELVMFVERARDSASGDAELAEQVRRRVLERTGLAPAAVHVLAPGTLPRTSSGKIRRAETRRRFLAGELHPPRRVTVFSLLAEMLRSRLALAWGARAS